MNKDTKGTTYSPTEEDRNLPYVMIKSQGKTWWLDRNYNQVKQYPDWAIQLEVFFIENNVQHQSGWMPSLTSQRPDGVKLGQDSEAYWVSDVWALSDEDRRTLKMLAKPAKPELPTWLPELPKPKKDLS